MIKTIFPSAKFHKTSKRREAICLAQAKKFNFSADKPPHKAAKKSGANNKIESEKNNLY